MVTKEWVAIHRKHHAKVETHDDPHSPVAHGIDTVFWTGSELYRAEAKNLETLDKYGHGTPDDWIERNLYTRFSWQGVGLMLAIDLVLFGAMGMTIWAVQMLWIPITAAGIINGIGHYWGYRSYACADASTNIVPWGILIGGEELHNNHHAYATSAKLSSRWYEFDIGWMYIQILAKLGLADVRKVAPKLKTAPAKSAPDLATLQAVITHRYHVATAYARTLKTACATELAALRARARQDEAADVPSVGRVKRWLTTDPAGWSPVDREHMESTVAQSQTLAKIVAMRSELAALWERSTESSEQLLARLQDWCHRAESSGIPPLAKFSLQLRRYT
jgi:stearoyl-CoA desaturase (delta-9 desaturase)